MRLPSKVTPYKDSILAKFPVVLATLQECDMTPSELYNKVKRSISTAAELVEILDCLYALGKVELLYGEVLHYVKNDSL